MQRALHTYDKLIFENEKRIKLVFTVLFYMSAVTIAGHRLFKQFYNFTTNKCVNFGAAIAQWIRLCLPSCRPEFGSQAHHQRFL